MSFPWRSETCTVSGISRRIGQLRTHPGLGLRREAEMQPERICLVIQHQARAGGRELVEQGAPFVANRRRCVTEPSGPRISAPWQPTKAGWIGAGRASMPARARSQNRARRQVRQEAGPAPGRDGAGPSLPWACGRDQAAYRLCREAAPIANLGRSLQSRARVPQPGAALQSGIVGNDTDIGRQFRN